MSRLLRLAHKHRAVFTDEFLEWLFLNEHMYALFEVMADRLWNSGRRHYSARTIGEKMRFDIDVESYGDNYKLRNAFTGDLGRLYVLKHPTRVLLFAYTAQRPPDFIKYVCDKFKLTVYTLPKKAA